MARYSPRRSWQSHVRIWTPAVLALLCIAFFLFEEHAYHRRRETAWTSAIATAEDTRIHPLARFALEYGGKPLYEIDVLASYTAGGAPHKDWLPLSEAPATEQQARAQAIALRGKPCFVRWDPANPDSKIVERQ